MDVHVLTRANRHLYEPEVDEYHRARHRVFVDELKWRGLRSWAGREYDQFDCDDAVYLLGLEDGMLVGGVRLLPTLGPHLIFEVFPHLVSVGGIPRRADIAESTRFFVVPERRAERGGSRAGSGLIASMIDYGLRERISSISLVMNITWLPKFRDYGWTVESLGSSDVHDGEQIIAVKIAVTPEALRGVRNARNLSSASLLRWRGEITPFIPG